MGVAQLLRPNLYLEVGHKSADPAKDLKPFLLAGEGQAKGLKHTFVGSTIV